MAATFYDIVYRGKGVAPLNYHVGAEKWSMYSFERRGDVEADATVTRLQTEGYEAIKVAVGGPRKRDIDD